VVAEMVTEPENNDPLLLSLILFVSMPSLDFGMCHLPLFLPPPLIVKETKMDCISMTTLVGSFISSYTFQWVNPKPDFPFSF